MRSECGRSAEIEDGYAASGVDGQGGLYLARRAAQELLQALKYDLALMYLSELNIV